jgi:hypothetical protein
VGPEDLRRLRSAPSPADGPRLDLTPALTAELFGHARPRNNPSRLVQAITQPTLIAPRQLMVRTGSPRARTMAAVRGMMARTNTTVIANLVTKRLQP